jgi:ribose transport system substrate-binding protein
MVGRHGFKIVVALVLFCFVGSFAFASGDKKNKVIVYTGMPKTLTFFISLAAGTEAGCKKFGYTYLDLTPPEMDVEMQIHAVENALIKGIDGIVMAPIDARPWKPTFDKAQKMGIPIVVIDAPIDHPAVQSFVGTDNLEAARLGGRYIVDITGAKGELLLIGGEVGHPNGDKRAKGVREVCEAAGMKVTFRPADWNSDKAMQIAQDELSANKKFSVIFSAWDPGALAAKQAAKALGILDDIFIVGFDGNVANYRAIKEGEITATVRQQPYLMGTEGVEIITKIFNGETDFPAEKLIPGQVIDISNVDTVFSE